jgi:pseudouridylate synthase
MNDSQSRAGLRGRIAITAEVADALAAGRPVVALESTLISHGLAYPHNLAIAQASEAAIREAGAVPATIAIHAGCLKVGLTADEMEILATTPGVRKVARPSLAIGLVDGGWGGTTVSATMLGAAAAGIRVFATGGIGGVHRGALDGAGSAGATGGTTTRATFDISSDLEELARTPVAVVCAGPKAILDVPATIEYLETRGVPVICLGVDEVPGFYSRRSGVPAPASVPDIAGAATIVGAHLGLGLGSGILVCAPVPEEHGLPFEVATAAIERAIADATAAGIHGPKVTPWVLARVAELTDGAAVRANTALIENNARVAGRLAVLLGSAG